LVEWTSIQVPESQTRLKIVFVEREITFGYIDILNNVQYNTHLFFFGR
jgi:hypothetical protein